MIEIENYDFGSDSSLDLYKPVENYRLLSEMRQEKKLLVQKITKTLKFFSISVSLLFILFEHPNSVYRTNPP